MKFEFEKFVETDASFSAKVTIRQRTGQLGFNSGAVNRFKLEQREFAILYFDPSRRVVGLEFVDTKQPGAIRISRKPSNTYIKAKNFFDKYGIEYSESRRFELQHDAESSLLYFCVDCDTEECAETEASDSTEEFNDPNSLDSNAS